MEKENIMKSGAKALECDVVEMDLENITDQDLELIYGERAEEVRKQVSVKKVSSTIRRDGANET